MTNRQVQKMFQLMASGEAVEVASPMASVKKLARLAFVAQQFGYEYADVRQGGGHNSALKMLIVPDPGPHARQRAAQNWAQFPQAATGGPLPPFVPDALELLKARINFDLTGKSAEKRMLYGALGGTVGCVVLALRTGGDGVAFAGSGIVWALLLGVLGIGFAVTRKRNAKFAARLRAAGFTPVTDETGRVRYLPQGAQVPGHANPFGNPFGGAGTPAGGGPYAPQPGVGSPYAPQPGAGGPYASQSGVGGPYVPHAPQPGAGVPYAPQPQSQPTAAPYTPGSYATPQAQGPYAAPQPPAPSPGLQPSAPYSGPPATPYTHPGPVPPQPQSYPQPQPSPQTHPQAGPPTNPYATP
ncbi:hypothetical protein QFZ24_006045 [Streptomyces phaeochromogenes]|uniref:hypothetical protein n=1 Tax=Streptomyces phaeochromogenes TaxID=1923 RepID=UPI00278CF46D|nr:hypothetical protein [Streptomyces phaeochromogenes]MDQ0952122.1 hypothetical protein [Streptomyces phaeochromogenes]